MVFTLQVAALLLLVLNLPPVVAQIPIFPAWWTVSSLTAVVAPAGAILALHRRAGDRTLKVLCGLQAVTMVACLALVPVALDGARLAAATGAPWLTEMSVIAGAAAGVRWGWLGTAVYSAGLQTTLFGLVLLSSGDPVPGQALNDAVFGVFYVTLFSALAVTLTRAGTELDESVARAISDARAVAAAEASRAATRRVESLIHDSVIVALLTYSKPIIDVGTARREARRALDAINAIGRPETRADLEAVDLVWALQALTTETDPDIAFDYRIDESLVIPVAAAQAMTEAVAEALRNTATHAGTNATREVRVTISDLGVEIVVLDDGRGFDPTSIPPSRLGVRQGILERMASVAGGWANVTSSTGYGTVVVIRWRR